MTGYEQIREVLACICGICGIHIDCMSTVGLVMMLNWIQLKVLKGQPLFWSSIASRSPGKAMAAMRTGHPGLEIQLSNYQVVSHDINWSLAKMRRACPHASALFIVLCLESWRVLFRVRWRSEQVEVSSLAASRIPQVVLLSSLVPVLAARSAWRSLPMSLQRDKRKRQWQLTHIFPKWLAWLANWNLMSGRTHRCKQRTTATTSDGQVQTSPGFKWFQFGKADVFHCWCRWKVWSWSDVQRSHLKKPHSRRRRCFWPPERIWEKESSPYTQNIQVLIYLSCLIIIHQSWNRKTGCNLNRFETSVNCRDCLWTWSNYLIHRDRYR